MTIDEAIKHAEEVAEENQRVVDTGIVFNDVSIDMLYCDDTEVIEEHLANYQRHAEEYRQLAEWLKELKQLREPKTGHWILTIEDWNKWTCSECGFKERTDIHVTLGYCFCPKCGAKMESEG